MDNTASGARPLTSVLTSGDLATRLAAFDFSVMGQLLPNPDPLLKQLGRDIKVYREIARDSHVGACIRRRKSAVKSLEWGLDRGQAASRVAKAVADLMSRWDMERIIGQTMEAVLYGYQPMELSWQPWAGIVAPLDIQAKPPEWFCFDADAQLRFRSRANPVYGDELPARKFALPRQDPSYQNPYGSADLALCYWPSLFRKGTLRFWLTFAEKYGGAFAVGKLPRGAAAAERTAMLQSLEDMLQDAVATIPDDGSVALLELGGKSASSELYERLAMYCRSEISIVLTGTNQTVEASANKASAHAGMDVAGDLRDADAEIVSAAINEVIGWTVAVNWPGAPAPVFSMWDQVAQDELQAARDKSNYDAGARFTNIYWERAYGYQAGDLAAPASPALALPAPGGTGAAAAAFAEAALQAAAGTDPLAPESNALAAATAAPWQTLIDQVRALVSKAPDLATLQQALTLAYGDLDTAELVRLQAAAYALAQLKGMDAARTGSA